MQAGENITGRTDQTVRLCHTNHRSGTRHTQTVLLRHGSASQMGREKAVAAVPAPNAAHWKPFKMFSLFNSSARKTRTGTSNRFKNIQP